MNRYTVCHLVSDRELSQDDTFSSLDWPAHITLLGSFVIDNSVDQFKANLLEIAQLVTPFSIEVGDDSLLGENHEVLVSLVNKSSHLQGLHNNILAAALLHNAQIRNPQFTDKRYTPHITVQKTERYHSGDTLQIKDFHLIQHEPNGIKHERQIIETYTLIQ